MLEIQTAEPRKFAFAVDGDAYSVPLLTDMPYDVIKSLLEARKTGDAMQISEWFISFFETHAPGCTAKLSYNQIVALLESYDKACNTGE